MGEEAEGRRGEHRGLNSLKEYDILETNHFYEIRYNAYVAIIRQR